MVLHGADKARGPWPVTKGPRVLVRDIRRLARAWVEERAGDFPGFLGAHLGGGITALPPEAPFETYRDVDVSIVVEAPPPAGLEHLEVSFQGLLIEGGPKGVERYRSPELVLADPYLAGHLAADSILVDPTGRLAALHETVARAYAAPRWVAARCAPIRDGARKGLDRAHQAPAPHSAYFQVLIAIQQLAAFLALAHLRLPTHRGCLVLLRQLLGQEDRSGLFEETLAVLGFDAVTPEVALGHLEQTAVAFDAAVPITRSPTPFAYKLRPHLRPYLVDGTRAMIAAGDHREAMWWIAAWTFACGEALRCDGPEAEQQHWAGLWHGFVHGLGWRGPADVANRLERADALESALAALAQLRLDHPVGPAA